MKIVSHVLLAADQLSEMPERIANQWSDRLQQETDRIIKHLNARIPDEERFQSRVADAAMPGYIDYVNKDYISKGGLSHEEIVSRYGTNIKDAYEKYREGLDYIYEEIDGEVGKRFKEKVRRAKKHYAKGAAKKVFSLVGSKLEGLGPIPLAGAWLTNQQKVSGDLRGGDRILEGGPYLITTRQSAPALRAILNHRLVQAGVTIFNAHFSPTVFKSQNDLTNSIVEGLVDKHLHLAKFEMGGDSRVDYRLAESEQLVIDIQVSQK